VWGDLSLRAAACGMADRHRHDSSEHHTRTALIHSPHATEVTRASEALLRSAFARLDRLALGISLGAWSGFALFFATAVLVIKGGPPIGPTLGLLNQYFPGYTVTWTGSLLGLGYGFVSGFVIGWLVAFLRNLAISAYLHVIKLKSHFTSMSQFLDE
jgi:hypothetical protein